MKAIKANKVYTINESQKNDYLNDGYDIYDDDGKVVTYSPKKSITYNEYLEKTKSIQHENTEKDIKIKELVEQLSLKESEIANLNKSNTEKDIKIKELEKTVENKNK